MSGNSKMQLDYWVKQGEKPAFPDLLWSRPETKQTAGKLLIVGGHATSFAAPAESYAFAEKAGVGSCRVLLPDSLQKTIGRIFPEAVFAPSNPSGGLAKSSLAELLDQAAWADGILLAGDIGRNSETVALLETFLAKCPGQVTLTRDIADEFCARPAAISGRNNTLLVLAPGQLQKLAVNLHWHHAFTSDLALITLVGLLHDFSLETGLAIITRHAGQLVVAVHGQVSTTPGPDEKIWRLQAAARAATWWLQNPNQTFAALASSLFERK